ncbi:MAG: CBS domain-containing protein, partial [Anderseniella sp.]|nr:CBS domain-containing protein [Anderseniella sp.]
CWMLVDATGLVATSGIVAYAICGMMAVTSAVIGAPLTTILIVFELTRNYDLTIAAMVAVVFSNLVSYRVYGRSLFDVQLARKGVDLSQGRDRARLSTQFVSDLLIEDFARCTLDEPAGNVARRVGSAAWSEVFVLDQNAHLAGVFDARDDTGETAAPVSSVMKPVTLVFDEATTLSDAMRQLEGFVGDVIPVVDTNSNRFVGAVTETAIIKAYLKATHDLRREENATA